MSVSSPFAVPLLILLVGGAATAQPLPLPSEEAKPIRVIELPVGAPEGAPNKIRLGPGVITTLSFVSPLKPVRVEVEHRALFSRVVLAEGLVLIEPEPTLIPEILSRLTVRFEEGSRPASAEFLLFVEASRAEHQVNVKLLSFVPDFSRQQLEAERVKTQQCQEELTLATHRPEGLTGLIARRQLGHAGVVARELTLRKDLIQRPGAALWVEDGWSYRAAGVVAVELWVSHVSARPWTAARAALVGAQGAQLKVLRVWPLPPLLSDEATQQVIIEAEVGEQEELGRFTLTLWQREDETPSVSVEGVVFPSMLRGRAAASR